MLSRGETTHAEIQDLIAYHNFMHVETITATEAAKEFIKLCLTGYRLSVEGAAATKEASKVFGQCCVEDALTRSNVQTGFHYWRRKDTGFAPTYGQFLVGIKYRMPRDHRGQTVRALTSLLEVSAND